MSREVLGLIFGTVVSTTHREGLRILAAKVWYPMSSVRSMMLLVQRFKFVRIYFRGLADTQLGRQFRSPRFGEFLSGYTCGSSKRECAVGVAASGLTTRFDVGLF